MSLKSPRKEFFPKRLESRKKRPRRNDQHTESNITLYDVCCGQVFAMIDWTLEWFWAKIER